MSESSLDALSRTPLRSEPGVRPTPLASFPWASQCPRQLGPALLSTPARPPGLGSPSRLSGRQLALCPRSAPAPGLPPRVCAPPLLCPPVLHPQVCTPPESIPPRSVTPTSVPPRSPSPGLLPSSLRASPPQVRALSTIAGLLHGPRLSFFPFRLCSTWRAWLRFRTCAPGACERHGAPRRPRACSRCSLGCSHGEGQTRAMARPLENGAWTLQRASVCAASMWRGERLPRADGRAPGLGTLPTDASTVRGQPSRATPGAAS